MLPCGAVAERSSSAPVLRHVKLGKFAEQSGRRTRST